MIVWEIVSFLVPVLLFKNSKPQQVLVINLRDGLFLFFAHFRDTYSITIWFHKHSQHLLSLYETSEASVSSLDCPQLYRYSRLLRTPLKPGLPGLEGKRILAGRLVNLYKRFLVTESYLNINQWLWKASLKDESTSFGLAGEASHLLYGCSCERQASTLPQTMLKHSLKLRTQAYDSENTHSSQEQMSHVKTTEALVKNAAGKSAQ